MVFFVFLVAVVVIAWVRKMRAERERWLARLQLPGLWICEDQENPAAEKRTIHLDGGLASGTYGSSDLGYGDWRLAGHTLLLRSDSHELALELIFHGIGKISLERTPGDRRIYNKRSGNVVPLVRRQP